MAYDLAPRSDGLSLSERAAWQVLAASTLGHVTHDGYLAEVRPLGRRTRICGNALTVEVNNQDSRILREALIMARAGDVLVVLDHDRAQGLACWGELRTLAGLVKGLAGVVIFGSVTDVAALRTLDLPIFHQGISALTIHSERPWGRLNQVLELQGRRIAPGDLIFGDEDGVFALPPGRARSLLPDVQAREAEDARRRQELMRRFGEDGAPDRPGNLAREDDVGAAQDVDQHHQ
ncbi:RraA family protein [Larsenimonas rhizosphaerae]|uniref:Putative 4-hydroxy-4-methyl-2-oxoglutarate aldolase n=1 Tax=Larsenimonas rhizosphaerae TaxID=2944682 RepID=A0AA42CUU3_9GAMM|nr:RraA family protein [Larsenimonas rhizosphaerae]MCX2524764.1 RraA family protein [Larsenimonas rhizosphaerae]